jgi:hypothetical protein
MESWRAGGCRYDVGARVHSESWGGTPHGLYTAATFQIDDFAYNHPVRSVDFGYCGNSRAESTVAQDFLIVRSAGNDGALLLFS